MTGAVAVICRLSPREDGKYDGVKVQERWGRAYAADRWPGLPVEVYPDEGVSASDGSERPALERFREGLAEGRFGQVCAVAQDRVSRETTGRYPWFLLAAEMVAGGVTELHTRDDGIVQVEGEVAGIKAVLAKGEVTKLRRRVNEVRDDQRRAGNLRSVLGGVPVLGYTYRDGDPDWSPEPGAVALLRDVAARALADPDHDVRAAYRAAIEARPDVRDAAGRVPSESAVREALQRPATAGLVTERGRPGKTRTGKRNKRRAGVKVIGRAAHIADPPLDEDTWRDLERRVFRARRRGRRVNDEHYWAGPLLRCGKCGNRLNGDRVSRYGAERLYYACKNPRTLPDGQKVKPCYGCSVLAADVNLMLRTAVEAWAAEPRSGFAEASQVRAGLSAERERLAADLADERRGWSRVARRWRDYDEVEWADMEAEHDAVVARIGAQMAGLDEALAEPPAPAEVRWERLTGDERRALVKRALVTPIRVKPGRASADARLNLRVRRATGDGGR